MLKESASPEGTTREEAGQTAGSGVSSSEAETAVAAYLRSLKAPAKPGVSAGGAATAQRLVAGAPGGQERRRSIRYKCRGSAEFRAEGSEVRTWGELQDVSLHGCYIEAAAAPAVGTILNMVLEVNRIRVRVKGEVRVSYPFMGIGVAYTEVTEEERAQLRKLLSSLCETEVAKAAGVANLVGRSQPAEAAISDPVAAIRAVVQFFQARSMLSRQDFWEVIRKSQTDRG